MIQWYIYTELCDLLDEIPSKLFTLAVMSWMLIYPYLVMMLQNSWLESVIMMTSSPSTIQPNFVGISNSILLNILTEFDLP